MNKFMRCTNKWVLALLLVAFVAGCNNDGSTPSTPAPTPTLNSTKAISAHSLDRASGTIDELAGTKLVP
jgi:hypothetical protein